MPNRVLPHLVAIAIAGLLLGMPASAAEESKFDESTARELTVTERSWFGLKSKGIRYDARMIRAAKIAQDRAEKQKTWYCWRYVKNALLAAGVVDTRPTTAWAKQAGEELCQLCRVRSSRASLGSCLAHVASLS